MYYCFHTVLSLYSTLLFGKCRFSFSKYPQLIKYFMIYFIQIQQSVEVQLKPRSPPKKANETKTKNWKKVEATRSEDPEKNCMSSVPELLNIYSLNPS